MASISVASVSAAPIRPSAQPSPPFQARAPPEHGAHGPSSAQDTRQGPATSPAPGVRCSHTGGRVLSQAGPQGSRKAPPWSTDQGGACMSGTGTAVAPRDTACGARFLVPGPSGWGHLRVTGQPRPSPSPSVPLGHRLILTLPGRPPHTFLDQPWETRPVSIQGSPDVPGPPVPTEPARTPHVPGPPPPRGTPCSPCLCLQDGGSEDQDVICRTKGMQWNSHVAMPQATGTGGRVLSIRCVLRGALLMGPDGRRGWTGPGAGARHSDTDGGPLGPQVWTGLWPGFSWVLGGSLCSATEGGASSRTF